MASNLGGGWHGYITLMMTVEYYSAKMGYAFVPLHKPNYYPPMMGTTQYQALGTEQFWKNQTLFRIHTAVDGALKN